jgi:hypothetical protein
MLRDIAGGSKICFLICIVFILTCSACSFEKESNNNIVYPPVRINGKGHMELIKPYTLSSAFDDSDLVAHIRVGNWLEETKMQTLYDAMVVSEYKGKEIKEIVLLQDGSSKGTFLNYPLFTYGNEMLLFLKKAVSTDYENAYWIIGAYTTIFDVVADSSDNYYLIDRVGTLSESLGRAINYSGDLQLRKTLTENLINNDKIWSEIDPCFDYIYSLTQIEKILQDLN